MEQPSSPEKELGKPAQFLIARVYEDMDQLQKGVDRLEILKRQGVNYDPLNEGVAIYDEKGEDITPEHPENVSQELNRKNAILEKLTDIRDFWHYYIVVVSEWDSENDQQPEFKKILKQYLDKKPERALWLIEEINEMCGEITLGRLSKDDAYKTIFLLRKALNVLRDPELLQEDEEPEFSLEKNELEDKISEMSDVADKSIVEARERLDMLQ